MSTSGETTESHMNNIAEDVISNVRYDLVDTGELDETVLRELQSIWKKKMVQAGLINSTLEISSYPSPIHTPVNDLLVSPKREGGNGFFIPQQDGANDEYIVAEPNAHAYNVDENDDEILNEDDDEEEDSIGLDDKDITHLVMCQFDNVKRSKNKWDCRLKSGIMQINGKNILFEKAEGVFNF
ncbi:unnamed protein product [Cochlearia groenlandica]